MMVEFASTQCSHTHLVIAHEDMDDTTQACHTDVLGEFLKQNQTKYNKALV